MPLWEGLFRPEYLNFNTCVRNTGLKTAMPEVVNPEIYTVIINDELVYLH
jgi:hypothetical protein